MTIGGRLQHYTEMVRCKRSCAHHRTLIKLSTYQRPVNPRPRILEDANVMLLNVHIKLKRVNITIFIYILLLTIFTISTNKKTRIRR